MNTHAQENFIKYAKMIPGKTMRELLAKMRKAVEMDSSVSCVVNLDKAVKNPYREDWQANDRIVAIVRNSQVVTVMLSRSSQINKKHLRTQIII